VRITPMLRHESLNQGALAYSGFPRDEHELTGRRTCLEEAPVEFFQLFLAVQKMHEHSHYLLRHSVEATQFVHAEVWGTVG
jgi:hypothetical protein